MSKFLKNSLPYLEIDAIKKDILKGILEKCNNAYKTHCTILETISKYDSQNHYIVNNNQKYYLLIFNYKPNYKTLYFFKAPSSAPSPQPSDNTLVPTDDSFCIEIDGTYFPKKHYLFEGYMYVKDNIMTFDTTDVIYVDKYINAKYSVRRALLHELLYDNLEHLVLLNWTLNLGIHHVLTNRDLIPVFQNNCKFKEMMCCIETVPDNSVNKTIELYSVPCIYGSVSKYITKGIYPDVYHVKDYYTNNDDGILYVKTLQDSVLMNKLFENGASEVVLEATFNNTLKKWSPVFNTPVRQFVPK